MFRSRADETLPPELADEPTPVPPVVKKPMRDARAFEPSSFASRRIEAERSKAPLRRRLVSLGQSEFRQRNNQGDIDVMPVELFYDRDQPSRRFVRFEGATDLIPLQDDSRASDQSQDLGIVKGRRLNRPDASAYPEPLPDQPPRLV